MVIPVCDIVDEMLAITFRFLSVKISKITTQPSRSAQHPVNDGEQAVINTKKGGEVKVWYANRSCIDEDVDDTGDRVEPVEDDAEDEVGWSSCVTIGNIRVENCPEHDGDEQSCCGGYVL